MKGLITVLLAATSFLIASFAQAHSEPSQPLSTIRPGAVWLDNRGLPVQAHGGGIIKVGAKYYWFGEQRSPDLDKTKRYVSCYSSKDLTNWTFRRNVVEMMDPENIGPEWVLERPKVFHNPKTKKFVMYAHLDGPIPIAGETANPKAGSYTVARVAVLISDKVDGDYKYLRSFRPLGHESRDIGQFTDDDGTAYLVFEDRPFGFRIERLSADYLSVEREMSLVSAHMEGGAIVHYQDLYYAIGSGLTGWAANRNKYATAKSLEGPWSEFKDVAPPETKTYGAQSTMIIKVVGSKKTTVIFMGDIWKPKDLPDSRYLWMPLEIGDGKLFLSEPKPWIVNVKTGETMILK